MMNKEWAINIVTQEVAMEWAKMPCWSLGEAHWLLAGFAPEIVKGRDLFPDIGAYGKEAEALRRAVDAGLLVSVGPGLNGIVVFKPRDIVQVAKDANIGMWRCWESVFAAMESSHN